jgi:carboxymethylenebutenolidase
MSRLSGPLTIPLVSEMLTVPRRNGRPLQAYFAAPSGAGPHAGVVVIHEIYGLNQNIRDIADRFAAEGYAALAVDLFSTGARPVCMARIMNGMLLRPLKNGVVQDLRAALDFLGARPEVDAGRLGAIGFCMGGTYALQLACVDEHMKVASLFYGMNPRPLEAVARACPLVGSYPERDFTAGAGRKLDSALDAYGVAHDMKVYPGTRHSFFNDRGAAHDTGAAADSWQRTLSFFHEHLAAAG